MSRHRMFRLGYTNGSTGKGSAGRAIERSDPRIRKSREAQVESGWLLGRSARAEGIVKRVQSLVRCFRGQRGGVTLKGELVAETELVKLGIEIVGKRCLLPLFRIGFLLYLSTKQTQPGKSELCPNSLHPPRCNNHNELNKLATLRSRLCHRSATRHCSPALQSPQRVACSCTTVLYS